ncbi:MAG: winged helix-turn-helix domain-containing protein [Chloroflexota bacterium]|nr:winged helix-turn-helix domain-containing protein [Chloroflexota bacterium]
MTIPEAAYQVLQEAAQPMTTRELYGEIMRRGLIEPKGKTPFNTMVAYLYRQTQRDDARFIKMSTGTSRRSPRATVRWTLKSAEE